MSHNTAVQLSAFGGPEQVKVVDTVMPVAGPGEVLVKVLASSVQFTDTVIRRHRYPQVGTRPPFVLGYDVVGEIVALGPGVSSFAIGERVADLTVTGSNAQYRTLKAERLTRVPTSVDSAEAVTLVLSWVTAYQMIYRVCRLVPGQRVLVQGAAGAVGQALVVLCRLAGLKVWGTAAARDAGLLRELGAMPIDFEREDVSRAIEGGFDAVFDGIGEDGYRRSWAALAPKGRLCAFGFSAAVARSRLEIAASIARLYLWSATRLGRSARFFSINRLRSQHPELFKQDLARLFDLLAEGKIKPRVAERIGFDAVRDAHRRLEEMTVSGKLVLCP